MARNLPLSEDRRVFYGEAIYGTVVYRGRSQVPNQGVFYDRKDQTYYSPSSRRK